MPCYSRVYTPISSNERLMDSIFFSRGTSVIRRTLNSSPIKHCKSWGTNGPLPWSRCDAEVGFLHLSVVPELGGGTCHH